MAAHSGNRLCTLIATADTRAYTARYDRIYVRGLEATAYQLIANKPLTPAGGHCMPWNGGHVVCVVLLARTAVAGRSHAVHAGCG